MAVESNRGRWVVPSSAAIWLRPMVEHQLIIQSQSRIYGILVNENTKAHLPPDDGVLLVSPMLRELISQITKVTPWDAASKRNALVRALFLEELYLQPHLTFYLPLPTDKKMAEICRRLVVAPADTRGVEEWAKSLSVSEKTFQRHFIKQTGMTFGQWKQRLRLLSSITLLLAGNSIINTALESGYGSHSAYSTAFKKLFGVSPSHFIYSSLSNPRQAHGFNTSPRLPLVP